MNERIKELMALTNAWEPDAYPSGEGGDAAWKNLVIFDRKDLEKFAELIVEECIKQALGELVEEDDGDEYLKGNNGGVVDAVCAIRCHFGVENEQR